MIENPTYERFQLLKARLDDGTAVYGVLDFELEIIVAEGTREEMVEYAAMRTAKDNISTWQ